MPRHDQITRILTLAQALATSRRGVPLRRLAEQLGINLRTVYRDIEALQQARFPIICEEGRYRMMDAWAPAAQLGIDGEEIAALFVAKQLAGGFKPTTVGRALERLWMKLTTPAGATGKLIPEAAPTLSVRASFAIDYAAHQKTIALLEKALRERVTVACQYQALSSGQVTARVIEPGDLHWDPGLESLYLIAWCRLRQDVRIFAVHRFRLVSLTRERFSPRAGVRSRVALRNAFRVWRSSRATRVVVRFTSEAAPEIRERRVHGSQVLRPLDDGGVELSFEVAGMEEVARWVLGYGGSAQVIEPPELVGRVQHEAAEMARAYGRADRGNAVSA